MSINLTEVGLLIYIISIIYILVSKDLISILIALELSFLSLTILLINASTNLDDLMGATLSLYVLPLAGGEAAIGLSLLVAYYPKRGTLILNSK